jgi:hypothetical protein
MPTRILGTPMLLPDGALGVLDCGKLGRLDEEMMEATQDIRFSAIGKISERLDNLRCGVTTQIWGAGCPKMDGQRGNPD